jgi:hypothetical protein
VIDEVGSDAWKIENYRYTVLIQMFSGAYAGKHENLDGCQ